MKFKLHINQTIEKLLAQEDTDGDKKITIDDHGPKSFLLKDENGNSAAIEGTYQLSNLLQELALAKKENTEFTEIDLNERHIIIKNASLKDAKILDENYSVMIAQTYNYEERSQFVGLRKTVLVRIDQLTQKSG